MESWDFECGSKLMEHSWRENNFVQQAMKLLQNKWARTRVSWEGDYADEIYWEDMEKEKLLTPKEFRTLIESSLKDTDVIPVREEIGYNLYFIADYVFRKVEPNTLDIEAAPQYLYNIDRNEYVDVNAVPDHDGWAIHPLPLLTCNGNGRGGGDFHIPDPDSLLHSGRGNTGNFDLIGYWCGDRLFSAKELLPGFTEVHFDLMERW